MMDLLAALQEEGADDEAWFRITGAGWSDTLLTLTLSVQFDERSDAQSWIVACRGTVEESLTSAGSGMLYVRTQSPLLLPLVETQVDIMFAHNQIGADALLGMLCSICTDMMGRPGYLARFLNGHAGSSGIVSSPYGLLGRFPASVASRIRAALKDQAITLGTLDGRVPVCWDGHAHVPYPPLQVLELGDSYVIAEHFSARPA